MKTINFTKVIFTSFILTLFFCGKVQAQRDYVKAKDAAVTLNAGDTITLNLNQAVNPEHFDLTDKGLWTETYNIADYSLIEFNYGNPLNVMSFSHEIGGLFWEDFTDYWDGFTYSVNGDSIDQGTDWINNQWGNMAGGGIKTDADNRVVKKADGVVDVEKGIPYLVAYWGMEGSDEYYLDEIGMRALQTVLYDTYEAVGMYVNNHPWPYYCNIAGNDYANGLKQAGDYFKLIIHGLDSVGNETGKTVEYVLAENKAGEGLLQSRNWEWVDLSPLGKIGGLYYTLSSSDVGTYGTNTPLYFCLDKLQVRVPKEDTAINHPDGVQNKISVYPNPFSEAIFVNATTEDKIVIYDLSGQTVLSATVKPGKNTIDTSALIKGAYILKSGNNVLKIIK